MNLNRTMDIKLSNSKNFDWNSYNIIPVETVESKIEEKKI